jgi:hypothetical protein
MEQLGAMGFDEYKCERALAESDQDVEAAVEFLFSNAEQPESWWRGAAGAADSAAATMAMEEGVPPPAAAEGATAQLRRENTSFQAPRRTGATSGTCDLEQSARTYVRTLGIHEAYFDERFDCCFCERCYPAALPDTIANEGPTGYVVPRGWFRVGLALPPRAKALDIFNRWSASFHGVKDPLVLQSILECGRLMKPGDKLMNGTTLRSTKCAGRQDEVMYTSPTIQYAGMKFYARPQPFVKRHFLSHLYIKCIVLPRQARDKHRENSKKTDVLEPAAAEQGSPEPQQPLPVAAQEDDSAEPEPQQLEVERMGASIVLQVRQKPGSFEVQGETMGFEKPTKSGKGPWPGHLARACPHVSLESIEWKTDTTVAAIPYGLLIRTFDLEETVRENAAVCLAPMINFTKTGSGQNMGKVEKRGVFCRTNITAR